MSEDMTSIKVRKSTAARLKRIGRKGETYDDIIELLLDNKPKRLRPFKETK